MLGQLGNVGRCVLESREWAELCGRILTNDAFWMKYPLVPAYHLLWLRDEVHNRWQAGTIGYFCVCDMLRPAYLQDLALALRGGWKLAGVKLPSPTPRQFAFCTLLLFVILSAGEWTVRNGGACGVSNVRRMQRTAGHCLWQLGHRLLSFLVSVTSHGVSCHSV